MPSNSAHRLHSHYMNLLEVHEKGKDVHNERDHCPCLEPNVSIMAWSASVLRCYRRKHRYWRSYSLVNTSSKAMMRLSDRLVNQRPLIRMAGRVGRKEMSEDGPPAAVIPVAMARWTLMSTMRNVIDNSA